MWGGHEEKNQSYRPGTTRKENEWKKPGHDRKRPDNEQQVQSNDSGSLINFIRSNFSCRVIHHAGIWPFVSSIFPNLPAHPFVPPFLVCHFFPRFLLLPSRALISSESVTVRFAKIVFINCQEEASISRVQGICYKRDRSFYIPRRCSFSWSWLEYHAVNMLRSTKVDLELQ